MNPLKGLYKTARWQQVRMRQLQHQPLCEYCLRDGIFTEATVCDHVNPHRGDVKTFWSGPFQSLCQSCHSGAKQREEIGTQALGVDPETGWPVARGDVR